MIPDDRFCSKDAPPELDAAIRQGFPSLRKLAKEKDDDYLYSALGFIHVHHKEFRSVFFEEIFKRNESGAAAIGKLSIKLAIMALLLSTLQLIHGILSDRPQVVILEKQLLIPSANTLFEAFSMGSTSVYTEDIPKQTKQ